MLWRHMEPCHTYPGQGILHQTYKALRMELVLQRVLVQSCQRVLGEVSRDQLRRQRVLLIELELGEHGVAVVRRDRVVGWNVTD